MLIVDKHCAVFTHNEVVIFSLEFGTLLHLLLYKQYMGKKDNKRSMAIKTSDQSEEINGTDRLQILTFLRLFQTGKNVFLAKKRRPANGKTREKSGHMTLSAVRGKRILYFIILFAKVSNLYLEKKNNRFWVRRLLDLSSETGTWSSIFRQTSY